MKVQNVNNPKCQRLEKWAIGGLARGRRQLAVEKVKV